MRIQLQDGGRKEIVGDDNRRLMHRQRRFAAALQMTQSPVEQIVDINIARLQIGIVQLAVLLAEVGQHLIPRPLRIALFLAQDIAGGFIEIRVVEQRVMAGENGRDIGRIALFRQEVSALRSSSVWPIACCRRRCSLAMSAPVCRTGRRAGSG